MNWFGLAMDDREGGFAMGYQVGVDLLKVLPWDEN